LGEGASKDHPEPKKAPGKRQGPFQYWRIAKGLPPVRNTFRQFFPEHALVVFGHQHALGLVALVEEREAEGEAGRLEDRAFCAQVITVRGLITVEMSPLMKPWRVSRPP
jgi:hypothetical protein